jgi:hypothetical protein
MKRINEISRKRFILWLFAFVLVSRVIYVFTLDDKPYYFDTAHYDTAAQHLVENQTFGPSLHYYNNYEHYCLEPVYPLFLAAIYSVWGQQYEAVRLVQVLLSLLQIIVLWAIAKKFLSARASRWVAVVAAFYPFYVYISGLLYVTQLFALLLSLACLVFLIYDEQQTLKWAALAGAVLGLAMLTRPVLMPGLVLFILWMLFKSGIPQKRKIVHTLTMVILVFVVMTPWTIRNYRVFGSLAPGRACLAETRVLDRLNLMFYSQKILSEDAPFPHETFGVNIEDSDSLYFHCEIDDRHFLTLLPLEKLNYRPDGHVGLLLRGGDPLDLDHMQAWTQSGDSLVPLVSTSEPHAFVASEEISVSEGRVLLDSSESKWEYQLVFAKKDTLSRLKMTFADPVTSTRMRRSAFLIGLDSLSLSANGYMVWLHPYYEADIWLIQDGEPVRSIDVKKMYMDKEPISLFQLIKTYPVPYLTRHYIPELLNFWSPWIGRITTTANRPGKAMQLVSLLFFTPILVLALFGIWALRAKGYKLALVAIPLLTISMGYALFFTEVRYRIPIDGFLIILAVAGAHSLCCKWRGKDHV